MLIDTHSHVNFNAFEEDANKVIRRALDENVQMINVGSQYSTSKRAVEIAEKYDKGVYAAVGLHPIHLETGLVKIKIDPKEIQFKTIEEEFDYKKYQELVKSLKVVAIGEIGLDYYWRPKTKRKLELFKEKQKEVFLKQLDLARELSLPVIFHCRMAHNDLLEILGFQVSGYKLQGVVHCFTGTWEQAQQYMEMGFYLGFNGLIFKLDFDDIIKKIPLEKILIETDCPYLAPPISVNQRNHQREGSESDRSAFTTRNEPIYVKYIAEKIAKIKNLSYKEIADITTKNAKNLFKI